MKNTDVPIAEAALSYARSGWPVFPLHGKVPYKYLLPDVVSHGHKDATTNEEQIQTWWSYHKGANIGLPTGKSSGVLVLDMDVPEGYFNLKILQERYGKLPTTRTSLTAGGSSHYFYQYPNDGTTYRGSIGLDQLIGLDIRAQGNYVVLPPSKLYGRLRYTWANAETAIAPAPAWLLSLVTQAEEKRHQPQQGMGFATSSGEKWLSEAIAKAREGNRNTVGFWLAWMLIRCTGRSRWKLLQRAYYPMTACVTLGQEAWMSDTWSWGNRAQPSSCLMLYSSSGWKA